MSYLETFTNARFKGATAFTLVQAGGNYSVNPANPSAARTLNIIDPGGTDDFLFKSATQTIYNKTLGTNLAAGGYKITGLANGSASSDAATYGQVQAAQTGITAKGSCKYSTQAALATYTGSGTSTLTASANAAISIDGQAPNNNDRILVRHQTSTLQKDNGLWYVYDKGSGGTPWVLKRTSDFDVGSEAEGVYSLVTEGTNASNGFIVTTPMPYTLNSTAISWTEFTVAPQLSAGNGISIGSGTISANADGTSITATGGSGTQLAVAATYAGGGSIATVGTITSGTWHGATIDDTYITTSYVKADGTRALTGNWAAGAFSATLNNVVVGSAANVLNNKDDAVNDSNTVAAFTMRGGNKTGASASGAGANLTLKAGSATGGSSTGGGGTLLLAGGSSVGGTPGTVQVGDATDNTKLYTWNLSGATGGKTMTILSSHTNNRTLTLPDATDQLVARATTDTLQNKTFADGTTISKTLAFNLAGNSASTQLTIAAGQTTSQTASVPNITGADTFVMQSFQQTLTNKTLTAPVIKYPTVLAKSANYPLVSTDESVNFTTSTSSLTATLPQASTCAGKRMTIRKVDTGSGSVTVAPYAGDTVNANSLVIDAQWDTLTFESDGGTNWYPL